METLFENKMNQMMDQLNVFTNVFYSTNKPYIEPQNAHYSHSFGTTSKDVEPVVKEDDKVMQVEIEKNDLVNEYEVVLISTHTIDCVTCSNENCMKKIERLTCDNERLSNECNSMKENISELQSRVKNSNGEIEKLTNEKTKFHDMLRKRSDTIDGLNAEIKKLKSNENPYASVMNSFGNFNVKK
jgi:predicted RNase H-like nuclease (RuvC/YqgF family)